MDNTQQTKPNSKGLAVTYLLFGIIFSVIPVLLIIFSTVESFFSYLPYYLSLIGCIIAIVFGVKELKLTKPDPKGKAIASLCFSCIGILACIDMGKVTEIFVHETGEGLIGGLGFIFFSPVPIGFGILGLISGIKARKSVERKLAIIGIILSIISITSPIWVVFFTG